MQKINTKRIVGNLALLTLGIALFANVVTAQGQGRRGGGGGGQNGQGRGSAMGQGMRSQNGQNQANGQMSSPMGQGGMNRGGSNQMPGIRGTIAAGDINTGQILIESPRDGTQQIIQVTNETQIFTRPASDQTAQAGGSQTATNANQTQGRMRGNANSAGAVGQRPAPPQGGNANQPRRGGGQGGGQRGMQSNGSMNQSSANGDGSMPPPPREMNLQQIAFTDLKVGDRLMAMGQMNSSGVFVATRICINMDMGRDQGGQGSQGGQGDQQNGMNQGGGRGRDGMGRPGQEGNANNSTNAGRRPGGRPRN